jgi:hypothetical protein
MAQVGGRVEAAEEEVVVEGHAGDVEGIRHGRIAGELDDERLGVLVLELGARRRRVELVDEVLLVLAVGDFEAPGREQPRYAPLFQHVVIQQICDRVFAACEGRYSLRQRQCPIGPRGGQRRLRTLGARARDRKATGRRARPRRIIVSRAGGKRRSGRRASSSLLQLHLFPRPAIALPTPRSQSRPLPSPTTRASKTSLMFHPLVPAQRQSHTNKRAACHCYAASRGSKSSSRCRRPLGASSALFVDRWRRDSGLRRATSAREHDGRHAASSCRLGSQRGECTHNVPLIFFFPFCQLLQHSFPSHTYWSRILETD